MGDELKVAVLVDVFPEVSETFVVGEVRGLRAAGVQVRVEALAHAGRPARDAESATWWEDDDLGERLRALAWLVTRHPLRCAADLLARRRWRREEAVWPLRALAPAARRVDAAGETHLHAHFAAGAALSALRLARLLGTTWSFTAHGYDIFQSPRNLREKLRAATFATSGSAYTVAHLRDVAPEATVHVIVMGVDPAAWPQSPPSASRRVVSVGRLVEKKGFADLVAATALLRDRGRPPAVVTIVGEGPLRDALEAQVAALEVGDLVELPGACQQAELPALLAGADVFCLPCVIAADGDRDSMPVVAKEALAAQRPVVVTDEVAFPELVRPDFGRLVPPGDPAALAEALDEVLSMAPEVRAEMGRAGRLYVEAHANVWTESAKLAGLLRAAAERG